MKKQALVNQMLDAYGNFQAKHPVIDQAVNVAGAFVPGLNTVKGTADVANLIRGEQHIAAAGRAAGSALGHVPGVNPWVSTIGSMGLDMGGQLAQQHHNMSKSLAAAAINTTSNVEDRLMSRLFSKSAIFPALAAAAAPVAKAVAPMILGQVAASGTQHLMNKLGPKEPAAPAAPAAAPAEPKLAFANNLARANNFIQKNALSEHGILQELKDTGITGLTGAGLGAGLGGAGGAITGSGVTPGILRGAAIGGGAGLGGRGMAALGDAAAAGIGGLTGMSSDNTDRLRLASALIGGAGGAVGGGILGGHLTRGLKGHRYDEKEAAYRSVHPMFHKRADPTSYLARLFAANERQSDPSMSLPEFMEGTGKSSRPSMLSDAAPTDKEVGTPETIWREKPKVTESPTSPSLRDRFKETGHADPGLRDKYVKMTPGVKHHPKPTSTESKGRGSLRGAIEGAGGLGEGSGGGSGGIADKIRGGFDTAGTKARDWADAGQAHMEEHPNWTHAGGAALSGGVGAGVGGAISGSPILGALGGAGGHLAAALAAKHLGGMSNPYAIHGIGLGGGLAGSTLGGLVGGATSDEKRSYYKYAAAYQPRMLLSSLSNAIEGGIGRYVPKFR